MTPSVWPPLLTIVKNGGFTHTNKAKVDIKQLRTVLAIAETGSLTHASELLHVVQPALSRQLRLLEEELGSLIFERNSRGMTLTPAGHRFIEQVRTSLQALDQAKAEMGTATSRLTGIVSIGLLPSLANAIAAPLITKLRGIYPDLKIRLMTGFTQQIQESLERGILDIGLLGEYRPSDLLVTKPVLREPLYLVGLPQEKLQLSHPQALNDVAKLPLVLPASSQGLRKLIDRACTITGVSLSPVAESDDTAIQLELVEQGVGLAILPAVAIAPALQSGRLSATPIIEPALHRTVVIGSSIMDKNTLKASTMHKELLTLLRPVFTPLESMGLTWLADEE